MHRTYHLFPRLKSAVHHPRPSQVRLPQIAATIRGSAISQAPAAHAATSSPSPHSTKSPSVLEQADFATVPSTAHALPLTGGNITQRARATVHADVLERYRAVARPQHASMHPADIVPSANAVFVGVGLNTNWPGLLAAMDGHVFRNRRVVAIRDVFDRSSDRECLADWFAVVADDVVAVDVSVVRPDLLRRRFINEYVIAEEHNVPDSHNDSTPLGSAYRVVRNDVDLVEFLHSSGYRVVPVSSRAELHALRDGRVPIPLQQSTNHVLLCAPTAFQYNAGAAADNHFMPDMPPETALNDGGAALRRKVLSEFSALHNVLTEKQGGVGAQVHLFTHEDWHHTPDAVFPNNTFSTHTNLETGDACTLVLYPMKDESRRRERRLVQRLLMRGRYTQVYDLTREETRADRPAFLEGTGSLVLDRVHRVAYVALSQRSDIRLSRAWARVMDYTLVPFTATDREGRAIYHTNVMMSVGTRVAVVCGESIADARERETVFSALRETGKEVINISYDQVEKFCGNVLELESFFGEQMMVMSSGAHKAFTEDQKETMLGGLKDLIHADISTIEKVGGGGVRCTIAELF